MRIRQDQTDQNQANQNQTNTKGGQNMWGSVSANGKNFVSHNENRPPAWVGFTKETAVKGPTARGSMGMASYAIRQAAENTPLEVRWLKKKAGEPGYPD
jgi:hypothetical protein